MTPSNLSRSKFAGFVSFVALATACGSSGGGGSTGGMPPLVTGQSDFESAPPNGSNGKGAGSPATDGAGTGAGGSGGSAAAPSPEASAGNSGGSTPREVEETDLYRLDGDRLYYLNSYRGLMVFDVSSWTLYSSVNFLPVPGTR